ncbi:MAG: hypothetical protein JSV85_02935 [Candidatus Bathyarchaeota archaeon]|nr:MAG: hypothetical protein JSV85_02935 [Candidatus Bathyarchaeota archaeon]
MLKAIIKRLKRDKHGVSNVIVVMLSLVLIVVIVANVVLWSYQMNQFDWERMQEDLKITDIARVANSSWFTAEEEYTVNEGSLVGGDYTDTQRIGDSYETFTERVVAQTLYLHRIDVSGVTPSGRLMDNTQQLSNQSETQYEINRAASVHFYTPILSAGSVENGTWILYIWASTISSGKVSRLTVGIHLVSSDGSTEKATIGTLTDVVVDYGYSERPVIISGSAVNTTSGDRIRITLYAQTGAANDPKGVSFYYDGYGTCETLGHETRLQSPSPRNYGLDLNGAFSINVSVYPLAHIQSLEIQLRYRANDTLEEWYLKAYNWTDTTYSDSGFNNTSGHTPTTGWDTYTVNLTDKWRSYLSDAGTMRVKMQDNQADASQTTIDIDFLAVRGVINGTKFTFENRGSLTSHLVSLWVNNSTDHSRYETDIFINSGDTALCIRNDITLPNEKYQVKVVTERGNIAVFPGP